MKNDALLEQAKERLRKADEPVCSGGPLGHLISILEADTKRSMAACGFFASGGMSVDTPCQCPADGGLLAARDDVPFSLVELEDGYDEAAYKQLLVSLMRDYYDGHPDLDRKGYLQVEQDANKARYMDLTVRDMTAFSQNIMFACDMDSMVKQRIANYNYLYERLKNHPDITIGSKPLDEAGDYVPFGLFLLVENRDVFYNYMVERSIIGEIQWVLPLEYYEPGEDAKYLSTHNLMIQCDQRYTEEDMRYVADSILAFFD